MSDEAFAEYIRSYSLTDEQKEALVREFQAANKLTVDGIVGANTYKALGANTYKALGVIFKKG